jgi:hypothetical protein
MPKIGFNGFSFANDDLFRIVRTEGPIKRCNVKQILLRSPWSAYGTHDQRSLIGVSQSRNFSVLTYDYETKDSALDPSIAWGCPNDTAHDMPVSKMKTVGNLTERAPLQPLMVLDMVVNVIVTNHVVENSSRNMYLFLTNMSVFENECVTTGLAADNDGNFYSLEWEMSLPRKEYTIFWLLMRGQCEFFASMRSNSFATKLLGSHDEVYVPDDTNSALHNQAFPIPPMMEIKNEPIHDVDQIAPERLSFSGDCNASNELTMMLSEYHHGCNHATVMSRDELATMNEHHKFHTGTVGHVAMDNNDCHDHVKTVDGCFHKTEFNELSLDIVHIVTIMITSDGI